MSRRGARELSYAELREQTSRFANVLGGLGVGAGERVFSLLGRVPELYVAALGTLKNRARLLPALLRVRPGAAAHRASRSATRACS